MSLDFRFLAKYGNLVTMRSLYTLFVLGCLALLNSEVFAAQPPTTNTLIANGSVWKYYDQGTDLGTAWRNPGYADGAWASGPAQLGYGDGDETTVVGFGPDP